MTVIYNLGPDDPNLDDLIQATGDVWAVVYYECEPYEGSGEVVSLQQDGKLRIDSLGHCSCYGPDESFGCGKAFGLEDVLASADTIHGFHTYACVEDKVMELLEQQQCPSNTPPHSLSS
jgi:hypothetical protein